MDYRDYYSILGVPRDADEQTIKSAFRRMARVYHPDVNANKAEATEMFKEINEAYTVLSDPDKRARYDLFNGRYQQYESRAGASGQSAGFGGAGPRPGYGGASGQRTGYDGAGPQPGYGQASGAGRSSAEPGPGQQRQRQQQSQRRANTRTIDEEDFERIFRGFAWAYSAANRRGRSGGTASDFSDFFDALFGNRWNTPDADVAPETSEARPGRDIEVSAEISLQEAMTGATRTLTYSDGRKVEVAIPAGVDSGSRLRIRGQGERSFGRPRGDLFMTIQVQPHPFLTRDGADLRVQVTVDYETAMRSGEVTVPTIDSAVKLKIPAGTRSGQAFRLRGLGMPAVLEPATRGDLIATVLVQPPATPPHSQTAKAARSSKTARPAAGRTTIWTRLRQALGASLAVVGLVALAAQAALTPGAGAGWQLLAALAVVLLVHGLTNRSGWALAGGGLALAAVAWTVSQLEVVTAAVLLEQAWPLLPLALGIGLLSLPAMRRA
jgi:DnaJ-class molecular chaperone